MKARPIFILAVLCLIAGGLLVAGLAYRDFRANAQAAFEMPTFETSERYELEAVRCPRLLGVGEPAEVQATLRNPSGERMTYELSFYPDTRQNAPRQVSAPQTLTLEPGARESLRFPVQYATAGVRRIIIRAIAQSDLPARNFTVLKNSFRGDCTITVAANPGLEQAGWLAGWALLGLGAAGLIYGRARSSR